IGQVFHITPGAIGTYETTLSGLLQLFGLSAEQALLVAVLAHGFLFLYSFLAGGVAMLLQSLRVRDVRRSIM
ncbi:MAG: flippase-like domain-containing protein, partial [Tumebacillaceae bacterium]